MRFGTVHHHEMIYMCINLQLSSFHTAKTVHVFVKVINFTHFIQHFVNIGKMLELL